MPLSDWQPIIPRRAQKRDTEFGIGTGALRDQGDVFTIEQLTGESYEDARKRATRAEFDDAFGGTGTTGDTAPKDAAVVADKKVRTMTLKGPKAVN
jgi:hypothetical protein